MPTDLTTMSVDDLDVWVDDWRSPQDQLSRLARGYAEMSRRLAAAEAIVSLLPKTTDGVPFMCGSVFCLGTHGGERAVFEYQAVCRFCAGHPEIPPYIAHVHGESVGKCYSTRAAAKAAWTNGG